MMKYFLNTMKEVSKIAKSVKSLIIMIENNNITFTMRENVSKKGENKHIYKLPNEFIKHFQIFNAMILIYLVI